jgi:hypothetical protein
MGNWSWLLCNFEDYFKTKLQTWGIDIAYTHGLGLNQLIATPSQLTELKFRLSMKASKI